MIASTCCDEIDVPVDAVKATGVGCCGAKPARVVVVEVAVAVARAAVTEAPACSERRGVGLIRRVVVERRGGVVLDVQVRATAGGVRVVPDVIHARLHGKAPGLVDLDLPHALHDLGAHARICRVAGRGVGARGTHRRLQVPVRRRVARRQPLLLLERDEDDLRRDPARHLDAVDQLRHAHRAALQRRAHQIARRLRDPRVTRRDAHVENVQALPVATRPDLRIKERLDLGGSHRVAVVEQGVRDDVLGIEADDGRCLHDPRVDGGVEGRGRRCGNGCRGIHHRVRGRRDDERTEECQHRHDGVQREPTGLRAGRAERTVSGVHVTIVTEVNS